MQLEDRNLLGVYHGVPQARPKLVILNAEKMGNQWFGDFFGYAYFRKQPFKPKVHSWFVGCLPHWQATAPCLVLVGSMMMGPARH